jgi:hypothetical protein
LTYEIADRVLGFPAVDWKERAQRQDKSSMDDRATRIAERVNARISNTMPTMAAGDIAGTYRCEMYGDISIVNQQGQLSLEFDRAPELTARLKHWHHDTYELDWVESQAWFGFGTVQIQQDNNGMPLRLLFDVPNDDIFFEEINAFRVKP